METTKWAPLSLHYVACGSCGRADRPHYGHGRCEECHHRVRTHGSWYPIKPLFCAGCERAGYVDDKYPGCGLCHELREKQAFLLQWRTSLDNPVVAQRVARAAEVVRSSLGIEFASLGDVRREGDHKRRSVRTVVCLFLADEVGLDNNGIASLTGCQATSIARIITMGRRSLEEDGAEVTDYECLREDFHRVERVARQQEMGHKFVVLRRCMKRQQDIREYEKKSKRRRQVA